MSLATQQGEPKTTPLRLGTLPANLASRAATINCDMSGYSSAVCTQAQLGGGNIQRTSSTLGASQIVYQAVDVTQTINNTSTEPVTVTVAPSTTSTTSSTSSSTAGAQTANGPWAMGGAVGAGLVALAAL